MDDYAVDGKDGAGQLAYLHGRLDAAIDHGCPLSLAEVRAALAAARAALFTEKWGA
jgi:hypothetical protein